MLATMLLAGVGCRLVELAGPPSQHGQREERTTGSIFVTTAVGATSGRDGLKQFVTATLSAFPDFHFTIEDAIAEGNKVAVRLTARGTHRGPLGDIPPTGNQVANTAIVIFRITDGKIVERWGVADQLLLLQQLGVIPPMGQAS